MIILGINAYHAEAAACLLRDGSLVAAAEEERFTRIKHVAGFPARAVQFCLSEGRVSLEGVDLIAVSRNPWSHPWLKAQRALQAGLFSRTVRSRLGALAASKSIREILSGTLGVPPDRVRAPIVPVEHHRAHIASSFYPSGWDTAAILSVDGFGDSLSGMWGIGRGTHLSIGGEIAFPHSLGVLYTTLTQFLGFHEWGDEYKVMGLAPYGEAAAYRQALETLAWSIPTGGYRLNLEYFRHQASDLSMTWLQGPPRLSLLFSPEIEKLLGPPRAPGSPLEKRHADIAAALQERLETILLQMLRHLWDRYRIPRLCYAGGVALNCSFNGLIRRKSPFQEVFIQPAAHDAGTAVGAALYAAHHLKRIPRRFVMEHAAWGPAVPDEEIRSALEASRLACRLMEEDALCETAAEALAGGKIVGWFQGRMEFGPRALGHRSLLADPRDPQMKDRINERVKRRESFRPFAPSILAERASEYFPEGHPDPFMLFAYPIRPELAGTIPSVVHVDGTGRLQAVRSDVEPRYWKLLKAFERRSGVPVLLNTSFNEQEPIVCRPEEAIACFRRNAIDHLAIGPFWVEARP